MYISRKRYCNLGSTASEFLSNRVRASRSSAHFSVARASLRAITQGRALFLWKPAICDPDTQVKILLFYLTQSVGQLGIANMRYKLDFSFF